MIIKIKHIVWSIVLLGLLCSYNSYHSKHFISFSIEICCAISIAIIQIIIQFRENKRNTQ